MASSHIPGPSLGSTSTRLGRQSQRSISTSKLPSRKPLPNGASAKSAATPALLTKRRPIQTNVAPQPQPPSSSGSEKREPPPPRPSPRSGRGYVGTTIPPPQPLKREALEPRHGMQPPSRAALFEPTRTPSLVSGSSVSTADSPKSNIIKRGETPSRGGPRISPDSTGYREENKDLDSLSSPYEDLYSDAVFGISLPPTQSILATKSPQEGVINLDRFINQPSLITQDLPPPTPHYTLSSTSSSRYSPGPFSVSSTPTSATGVSPGLVTNVSRPTLNLLRQPSPTKARPSNARKLTNESSSSRDTNTLSPNRKSSSSSGSTVRAGDDERKLRSPSGGKERPSRARLTRSKTRIGVKAEGQKPPTALPTIAPELEYLENASPMKRSISTKPPPNRPSRDGTPDMNLKVVSPVIHSNMSSLPASLHKRQGSGESRKGSIGSGSSVDTKSRFGLPRKVSSRNPSPSPISPAITSPGPRGVTPDIASDSERPAKAQPSPSIEKSQSRFGFFKRSKSETPAPVAPPKERRLRKGPAAGTGHEVYGKFGVRGRSGSATSGNASVGRSSSTDSVRGNVTQPSSRKNSVGSRKGSDVDEFLAERLSPITLRGTGAVNHGEEKKSGSTDQLAAESLGAVLNSSNGDLVRPVAVEDGTVQRALLPSPAIDSRNGVSNSEVPNDRNVDSSHPKSNRFGLSSLSAKRASRRSLLDGKSIATVQENLFPDFHFPSHPAINPLERKLSEPNTAVGMVSTSKAVLDPKRAETQPKVNTKLTRKWNFLWGNKTTTAKKDDKAPEAVGINIPKHHPPRSVAHYAMTDAPGKIDVFEIEKIMQEAESIAETSPDRADTMDVKPQQLLARHGNSILLPEPPSFIPDFATPARPASPRVALQVPQPSTGEQTEKERENHHLPVQSVQQHPPEVPNTRPSRLPQVGRIPRVVSKRDRERKPSIASFSRPFDSSQPSPAIQTPPIPDEFGGNTLVNDSGAGWGVPQFAADVETSPPILATTTAFTASPESFNATPPYNGFQSREQLGPSTSSSISGSMTLAAPLVIPSPRVPSMYDEVWSEYDDLLDLLSSQTPKTPKTPHTGSSLGAPFHYASLASPIDGPLSPDRTSIPSVPNIMRQMRFPSIRESQILASNAFATTPTSPVSVSDFLAAYGERTSSVVDSFGNRMIMPSTNRPTSGTARISLPAPVREAAGEDFSTSGALQEKNAFQPPAASRRESANIQLHQHIGFEPMANLRFSALMTSKWLSFGRVLFSPAHFELKNAQEDRVLVLDGLGKDWSFYVALNYKNAMIYNLGTDPVEPQSATTPSIETPPNHRHIQHPNLNYPFPFPKGFFAAVVFRFPEATSEAAYRFVIAECKRVLRPGGYLEISVLDMDMLNMGNCGRRALRSLKERMNAADSAVSLKPITDTIQRLLGRRGFENLNRCFVGVPAAGCIPSSTDGSSQQSPVSSSSTGEIFKTQGLQSLSDLIRDQSALGDENITRMVGSVARWWYSRCYESLVLSNGNMSQSIWSDEALVKECEKRGTSLRLMVCHAQKPECMVRRTISV